MKKSVIIGFLTIALVLSAGLYLKGGAGDKNALTSPPNILTPINCSPASVGIVWANIFGGDSSGVTIIANTSRSDLCTGYYAYRIVSGGMQALAGSFETSGSSEIKQITAIKGSYAPETNNIISSVTEGDVGSGEHINILANVHANARVNSLPRTTDVSSPQEAATEFNSAFAIENASEFSYDVSLDVYTFSYENSTGSDSTSATGGIFSKNYSDIFSIVDTTSGSGCTPSWQQINGSCDNDAFLRWYNDTNSCSSGTPPSDNGTEIHEDCDSNGIIGIESSIDDTNLNAELYIGGVRANFSEIYNTTENVELKDNGTTRVSFSYRFSSPLDLYGMDIKKQSASSSFGYLIVNGISRNKTVRVDRLNSSNARVCVEDKPTSSISSITSTCTGSDESLLNCPGSGSGFDCSISGGKFVVSGLTHSAVREMSGGNPLPGGCTENWSCTGWGACVNGNKIQTCTDLNNCSTTIYKPSEVQTCVGTTGCTENWNCTSWSPSECPENQTQTKTCTDLNNCGTTTRRPSLTQSCSYEKSNFWLIVIIVVVALLIIIGVIVLIGFLMRRRQTDTEGPPPGIVSGPPPLNRPPPSPVLRRPPPRVMPVQQPFGTPRF